MQAPAIDDHVSTKLYAWYTFVSAWEPPGTPSSGICEECAASAVSCVIDIAAWPHDVVHALVQSLQSAVRDVEDSYCEEYQWDCAAAPQVAQAAVADALARHAPDIRDVLEQCLSDKLDAWTAAELRVDEWELRRPAAS